MRSFASVKPRERCLRERRKNPAHAPAPSGLGRVVVARMDASPVERQGSLTLPNLLRYATKEKDPEYEEVSRGTLLLHPAHPTRQA
jgi:hypothetical protein